MHRNRHAHTFASNDANTRSARACRITSTGRAGAARSLASSGGAARRVGSAAHAAIHATNAARSAAWSRADTAFAPPAGAAPPISMSFTIFDFSGASRSISPWSRRLRNVAVASGRM